MQHTPAQHQSASGAPQTTAAAPLAAAAAASASGGTTRRNGGSSGKRRKSDITATTSGLPSAGDSVPPQSSDSSGEEGADPAAGGHQHTRSRSKRLSRGATQAQSSFSGMEVMTVKLSHGRQSAVLADISNQPTISQTTTRRQKSLAQQPQIVPEKLSLAHSRRRTTRTSGNGVALSVIPSPPASHGHDADRDCAMELAAPPSALTLDDDDGAAALNTSLDSNSSIHSFQSGLKDLRIQCEDVSMHADHSHQLDNTAASSSTIDSAGSAHTSFSVAFAAAHAHADGDSNGASLNSSFMSQGDCLESAFRPTRPSSTPEILTTAASTLTHSMTHSLQLEPNTAAAAPAAAGEAASAACLHPLVTLPSAPTLTVPSHSHATLAGVAPSNSSASAHGWAAHLLGASSVGGPSVPVSASVPLLEYSEEIWSHLLSVETKHLANPAYMDQVQSDLSYVMRSILMDWLIEVAEEYTLCSQTLFLCVNYVDRFLSVYPVDRAKLQLLGVACLLLASKYWEVRAPTVDDFIYISQNENARTGRAARACSFPPPHPDRLSFLMSLSLSPSQVTRPTLASRFSRWSRLC